MFYILKVIASFILPPGIFVVALLFLGFAIKRNRWHLGLVTVVALILYLFSTSFFGEMLMRSLEYKYTPPSTLQGDVITSQKR